MAKVGSFVFLGAVGLFVAWRAEVSNKEAADTRAAVIQAYRLDAGQSEVYDGCLDALKQKALKQGGDKASFCGCLSKSIANAYDNPKSAVEGVTLLAELSTNSIRPEVAMATMQKDSVNIGRFTRTAAAIRQCAEDQRAKWASTEELHQWCAAKPERSVNTACKIH